MARKKKSDSRLRLLDYSTPKARDYVVVELRHESRVTYSTRCFEGPNAVRTQLDELNMALEKAPVRSFGSQFGVSRTLVRKRVTAAPPSLAVPVSSDFASSGFVQIVPKDPEDCRLLARRLNRIESVWDAYPAPRPEPAAAASGASTASRNFEPAQGYLHSPPNGIGAMEVWSLPGALGQKIRICDIEGDWKLNHEDLPSGINLIGGTRIGSLSWRNHGTAVLGEMISQPGIRGTTGISYKAKAFVHSAVIGGVFNAAQAIRNASRRLRAGDVILIELHAPHPTTNQYVAMQFWPDVFSAIRTATAKGISVVEAAGNGGQNFQKAVYRGSLLQKDSGAIVVGAGVPPTNYFDEFGPDWGFPKHSRIGAPRSRIWFSNYGKIVNVQAWGWHVTTLGYGDAQGGTERRWYTHRFSGTSSASPIVTGAVACLQGRSKAKNGDPMTPAQVRRLLIRTGTSQAPSRGRPVSQKIGPQPNLVKAIRRV